MDLPFHILPTPPLPFHALDGQRAEPLCAFDDLVEPASPVRGAICEPEVNTGPMAVGDVDGDGRPDLYLGSLDGPHKLLRNMADGSWPPFSLSPEPEAPFRPSSGAAMADVDNDGDVDVLVTFLGNGPLVSLYIQQDDGRLVDEAAPRGVAMDSPVFRSASGGAFGDYDNDGDLDLLLLDWNVQELNAPLEDENQVPPSMTRLMVNNGTGHFADVTEQSGLAMDGLASPWLGDDVRGPFAFSAAFVDIDEDGWLDIVLSSDFATDRVLWNARNGSFVHAPSKAENAMGLAFADIDGNGRLDWYQTSIWDRTARCRLPGAVCEFGAEGSKFYVGGEERASDLGVDATHWAWGATFVDVFNSGSTPALYVVNGMRVPGSSAEDDWNTTPDAFFLPPTWENVAPAWHMDLLSQGRAVQAVDIDGDGDEDLVRVTHAGRPVVWENRVGAHAGAWLRVRVRNVHGAPLQNAIVHVHGSRTKHVGVGAHLYGTPDPVLHFGLGDEPPSVVPQVNITHAAYDIHLLLLDVPVNGTLTVDVPAATAVSHVANLADDPSADGLCSWSGPARPFSPRYTGDAQRFRALLTHLVPPEYADGDDAPAGTRRPSARALSNSLFAHPGGSMPGELSTLELVFLQFTSHDMAMTDVVPSLLKRQTMPIDVPDDDPVFTGHSHIRFRRSNYDSRTSPRRQLSTTSPELDASHVYGNSPAAERALRAMHGGHMRLDERGYPPVNDQSLPTVNPAARDPQTLLLFGDQRAHVWPGLMAMHVLFVREHNRRCDAIAAKSHTPLDDETLYRRARAETTALMQAILYKHVLPRLLGPSHAPSAKTAGPAASIQPTIFNEWTTAAARVLHSMQPADVPLIGRLRDVFNRADTLMAVGAARLLRELALQPAERVDMAVIDDLRNMLFGPSVDQGAVDLVAFDIQRGRDHGLASYEAVRAWLYLGNSHGTNDTDLLVGALREEHVPGGMLGPTFTAIWARQFALLRDSDPLFYTRWMDAATIASLDETTLDDVIAWNADP